jgi:hypothetical protein
MIGMVSPSISQQNVDRWRSCLDETPMGIATRDMRARTHQITFSDGIDTGLQVADEYAVQ